VKNWEPKTINEVVKVYPTLTSPILVETDAGNGVLKLPAGCGGTAPLICEFVGTSLARWIGVQTPDFALIRTDSNFVEMMRSRDEFLAEEADGFISRHEEPVFRFTPQSIQDVKNKDMLTRLVLLDTWIRNEDRYFNKTGNLPSRNTENVLLVKNGQHKKTYTVKAFDHAESFREFQPRFEPEKHFGKQAVNDPAVFGLFPEFDPYLDWKVVCQVASRLIQVNEFEVQEIFSRIPRSWILDKETKKAFIAFIVNRATFVAEHLPKKLFPNKIPLLKQTQESHDFQKQ